MQNAGMAALGLNWRYLACDVHPDHLRAALEGAKRMGFVGVNLTVPHKLLALEMMDELDVSAKIWGAVNTVRFETDAQGDVSTRGFNTDADAITRSLQEDVGVALKGARVLLLGAGGAGRTAALKLATEGVSSLFLVNRTRSKAETIAAEIKKHYPSIVVMTDYPKSEVDLVLNATSLGLKSDDVLPFDEKLFTLKQATKAYDMIYRPAETPFLKVAKAAGCHTTNGLGMLLYQGAKALEIWSGQTAPLAVMRAALEQNIYGH